MTRIQLAYPRFGHKVGDVIDVPADVARNAIHDGIARWPDEADEPVDEAARTVNVQPDGEATGGA